MAIAFVQGNSGTANASSIVVAFPGNVTAGNLIVAIIMPGVIGATYTSVKDSLGNGPSGSFKLAGTTSLIQIYYAWNIAGGADTVTFTAPGPDNFNRAFILEYSGVMSAGDPLDGYSGNSQSLQTLLTSGNITTTVAGDLLVAGFQTGSGGAGGSTHGMTVREDPISGVVVAKDTIVLGAAGSYAAQSDAASDGSQFSVAAAFKPPTSGPVYSVRRGVFDALEIPQSWFDDQWQTNGRYADELLDRGGPVVVSVVGQATEAATLKVSRPLVAGVAAAAAMADPLSVKRAFNIPTIGGVASMGLISAKIARALFLAAHPSATMAEAIKAARPLLTAFGGAASVSGSTKVARPLATGVAARATLVDALARLRPLSMGVSGSGALTDSTAIHRAVALSADGEALVVASLSVSGAGGVDLAVAIHGAASVGFTWMCKRPLGLSVAGRTIVGLQAFTRAVGFLTTITGDADLATELVRQVPLSALVEAFAGIDWDLDVEAPAKFSFVTITAKVVATAAIALSTVAKAALVQAPQTTALVQGIAVAFPTLDSAPVAETTLTFKGPMNVGSASNFSCTVKDANGALATPGAVTCEVHLPDGSIASVSVTNPSTGLYAATFLWPQSGVSVVRFTGTSPFPFIQESVFNISANRF